MQQGAEGDADGAGEQDEHGEAGQLRPVPADGDVAARYMRARDDQLGDAECVDRTGQADAHPCCDLAASTRPRRGSWVKVVIAVRWLHSAVIASISTIGSSVDGIAATGRICALPDPPKVIVLTTFQLDEYVFGALRAGASGFLLKDSSPTDIVQAVRLVAAGDAMLSPAITRSLIDHYAADTAAARAAAAADCLRVLTGREKEVAAEVGRGRSNAEIAGLLYMSEATVKAHISRVLTKLNATNRVQVAIMMRDAGLT